MAERVRVEGSLPQGTVTFLFTDIEGSTRLLERLGPDVYGDALQTHREVLRRAVNEAGGVEIDSQGDSLFAVFAGASGAVRAAVSAQRDLASHEWPADAELRVRMGAHTGEANLDRNGYIGIAVHRARRVCEAGHGGQIVVSSATRGILAAEPQSVRLKDLGEVRLPGFDEPERLFQIVEEGLPEVPTSLRAPRPWREEQRQLLERAGELAALDNAIAATGTSRGRLVVIEGPAGIGKSTVLAEGRERAAASGFSVFHARGSELESAFSFGVVRQLFESAIAHDDPNREGSLLAGAAVHAGRLFRDDVENAQVNEDVAFSVLHGLYWLTLNLTESRPLVITIDDLQWADAPSLRWMAYLARRIEEHAVCVIGTVRPVDDENPMLAELLVDPATTVLRPTALSAPAVAELVRAELAAEADDVFCSACYRATGGNPLLLRELVRTLAAEDVPPVAASAAEVERVAPDSIARSVMLRLSRLSSEAGQLARAVAILGEGADRDHLAALAGLERRQVAPAAATLARVDLLRQGPPFAFVHPLVRNTVYETIPAGERESGHSRAAEVLKEAGASPAQVAAHVLVAPPGSVAGGVEILNAAAHRATAEGGLESAAGYLSRCLDEPMSDDRRAELLLDLAGVELDLGRASVVDRLQRAIELIDDPEQLARTQLRLGRALYWAGREEDGVRILEGALAGWTKDDDIRRRLQADLVANATRLAGRFEDARRLLESLEISADEGPGARLLLSLQAYHEAATNGSRSRVVERAKTAFTAMSEPEQRWNHVGPCYTLLVSDHLDETVPILDTLIARTRMDGAAFSFAGLSIMRAAFHYARGALGEAEADARSALDAIPHRQVSWVSHAYGWLAQVLVERGGADEAAAIVDEGWRWTPSRADSFMRAPLLRARAVIAAAQGDYATSLDEASALGENLAAYGHPNPAFSYPSWRSLAAQAQFALGNVDEALVLGREEVAQARSWGAPRTLGRALRILGSIRGREDGLDNVREAVDVLQTSPAKLEHAYALADLGRSLRRTNRRAEGREALREALELARRCGATLLAERAHEELVAAGGRPRRLAFTGVDALTPSERRIADMAAEGLSNREIAQALFVTLRTVEMHLSNAFRKLGISARTQLAAALAAPDSAPDG
jgi:class 3 adenylate cyclase/DNA-binding CsgD family transcriptional regulator